MADQDDDDDDLPKGFKWPAWALSQSEGCIEVLVVDEDVSRWSTATPQSKVVDRQGKDRYLCAEYEWDGEKYVEDFVPRRVRRAGGVGGTVYEEFMSKGKGGNPQQWEGFKRALTTAIDSPPVPGPAQLEGGFDGDWVTPNGELMEIRGRVCLFPSGKSFVFEDLGGGACALKSMTKSFTGQVSGTHAITWEDGEVWTRDQVPAARAPPQAEVPAAALERAMAAESGISDLHVGSAPPPDRELPAALLERIMAREGSVDNVRTGEARQVSTPMQRGGAATVIQDLGEIVLRCTFAEGVDPKSMSEAERCIALRVDRGAARLVVSVGRLHQPDFFERMVPQKELLTCISRAHCELKWEAPASLPTLRKLSQNPLLIDDSPVNHADEVPLQHGTLLGFAIASGQRPTPFLTLQVQLRERSQIQREGAHPAAVAMPNLNRRGSAEPAGRQPAAGAGVAAVLECVHAAGQDLNEVPAPMKAIHLPLDKTVAIGRLHQSQSIEMLLRCEPQWMNYVSRNHLQVTLSREAAGLKLHVENLSNNVVFVEGRTLGKGDTINCPEGARVGFAAVLSDHHINQAPPPFLEFLLRRARVVP